MDFLLEEYKELISIINDIDSRILIIKGWSISFTLTTLVVAVQKNKKIIFLLAVLASLCFWILEAETKFHQIKYYYRMRAIEVQNSMRPKGRGALLIDWTWENPDKAFPKEIERRKLIKHYAVYLYPHVLLPHIAIIVFCVVWLMVKKRRPWFLTYLQTSARGRR